MQVLLPYVSGMLREETLVEVEYQAKLLSWPVIRLVIDPLDFTCYFRSLQRYWGAGQDFLVIEHDVVPPLGSFDDFSYCTEPLCTHPYVCGAKTPVPALGCTRFRSSLLHALPQVMTEVAEIEYDMPKMHWKRLDTRLYEVLESHGVKPHSHEPPATHLHQYPWLSRK